MQYQLVGERLFTPAQQIFMAPPYLVYAMPCPWQIYLTIRYNILRCNGNKKPLGAIIITILILKYDSAEPYIAEQSHEMCKTVAFEISNKCIYSDITDSKAY